MDLERETGPLAGGEARKERKGRGRREMEWGGRIRSGWGGR